MRDYLEFGFNQDDPELISIQDELPFWSAPFGMKLLSGIRMKKNMNVLDIGSGFGFPLIELAQRLGESSRVYGVDPWKPAIERCRMKINKLGLKNVSVIDGCAEELPFEKEFFDLIVSNNGINNVKDMGAVLKECRRTSKRGAQLIFTQNLEKTFIEFYSQLEAVLKEDSLGDSIVKMKEHIHHKRKPVEEIVEIVQNAGFTILSLKQYEFDYRFADAKAFFNYAMVKYWFLPSWKELVPLDKIDEIFGGVERRMNDAASVGELKLTVPFVAVDCEK